MTSSLEGGVRSGPRRRLLLVSISAAALATAIGLVSLSSTTAPDPAPASTAEAFDPARLTPVEAEARAFDLVEWALAGVYAAFERSDESAIYDALARTASGEALETLYLQRRAALADRGLDKVGQEVHELELISVDARRAGDTIAVDGRWRVVGVLGHAEHRHVRGNAYAAELVLAPSQQGWRITEFALTDVDRSDSGTVVGGDGAETPAR